MTKLFNETSLFADDIISICNPLKNLGINFFKHIRYKPETTESIILSNNPSWIETFKKKEFYKIGNFSKRIGAINSGNFLWLTLPEDGVREHARLYFNIDNGFTIVIKNEFFIDVFMFASTTHNEKINYFYLERTDILHHFIAYYFDQSKLILKKIKPTCFLNDYQHKENICVADPAMLNEFFSATKIKNFRVVANTKEIFLTKKQHELAKLYALGFSIKEIAMQMNIKPSTCISHLRTLQKKLHFNYKNELKKYIF